MREHAAKPFAAQGRGLREAQARFRIAFDHAPIGMVLGDWEGRWREVNDALAHITGCSRDELETTSMYSPIHDREARRASTGSGGNSRQPRPLTGTPGRAARRD